MNIMKIVEAGKKIRFIVMGVKQADGSIVGKIQILKNQGLGGNCHALTKILMPDGKIKETWEDPLKTEDEIPAAPQQEQAPAELEGPAIA
jgi:hypothetical protein